MQKLARKFTENNVEVFFKEDETAFFYAMKDNEHVAGAVRVVVKRAGDVIAVYHRRFETLSTQHYDRFVRKFLEDPEYRSSFATEGEWTERIAFTHESGVNKNCLRAITRVNALKNPKFKDFASLKTYGRDQFSSLKREGIESHVSMAVIEQVENELDSPQLVLNALRWVARGLEPRHAIRKIKTDMEIRQNMR